MTGTQTRMSAIPAGWRWPLLSLVALATVLLVAVVLLRAPVVAPADSVAAEGDLVSYSRIVERMRSGEGYYPAAHAVLVADGYGTRSVFNWRTPGWPTLLAALPPGGGQVVLAVLALAGLLLVNRMLRGADATVRVVSLVAVALSLGSVLVPESVWFSEIPAGMLILLSVAAYGNGWRWLGLVAALLALFLRELSAPYVLVCIVLSLRGHQWKELVAWGAGLALYALCFGWHWWMVVAQLGPMDRAYDEGWIAFGGLGFVLATVGFNGLWSLGPDWLPALLLPLALLGLWAWPNTRALAAVLLYLLAFLIVGKPFNAYWGAVYTPLLMLGLGWVWPAVRDAIGR